MRHIGTNTDVARLRATVGHRSGVLGLRSSLIAAIVAGVMSIGGQCQPPPAPMPGGTSGEDQTCCTQTNGACTSATACCGVASGTVACVGPSGSETCGACVPAYVDGTVLRANECEESNDCCGSAPFGANLCVGPETAKACGACIPVVPPKLGGQYTAPPGGGSGPGYGCGSDADCCAAPGGDGASYCRAANGGVEPSAGPGGGCCSLRYLGDPCTIAEDCATTYPDGTRIYTGPVTCESLPGYEGFPQCQGEIANPNAGLAPKCIANEPQPKGGGGEDGGACLPENIVQCSTTSGLPCCSGLTCLYGSRGQGTNVCCADSDRCTPYRP